MIRTGPTHFPIQAAPLSPAPAAGEDILAWQAALEGQSAAAILAATIERFRGRIALVSSFGAEAAVLLHLAAEIDRHLPILFLDTEKHFDATHTYRDILTDRFGFTDLRILRPGAEDLAAHDPTGDLHARNPDLCCHIRKVLPLERALLPFAAWISGRKRFQSAGRRQLPIIESENGRLKINPLAAWSASDIDAAFKTFALPRHPLFADGYASIGCAPCTRPLDAGEDYRAGRWSGHDKNECGIHLAR